MSRATGGRNVGWRIRAPREGDHPQWRRLYQEYADFYRTPQPDVAAWQVWSWIHDAHHELNCLLIEDRDSTVVGLAHYRTFARPLSASIGCFLDDLFIDPSHRGNGAVDALLLELRTAARENGWTVIRWITANDNARAIATYDRHATRTEWLTYDMPPAEP